MDYLNQLGPLVLASRLKNLSDTLMQGVVKIYREKNIDFEPRWFPVTYYLYHLGPAQVTHLARALRQTHPAVLQVTKTMHKKGLVKLRKDDRDLRKTIIMLTSNGMKMAHDLEETWQVISMASGKLLEENYIGILENIALLEEALDYQDMYTRIKREYVLKYLPELKIIPFIDDYSNAFRDIHHEWLEDTVGISSYDRKVMDDPQREVIGKGGQIYFAVAGDEIAGTVTLLPVTEEKVQLTKLAVRKPYRLLGIGKKLTAHAIEQSRVLGFSSILLLTHPVLKEAIDLYQNMGFIQTGPVPELPDRTGRCSLTMKLEL